MDPRDLLLLAVRWAHAAAAVAMVGGSAFYLVVVGPALRGAAAEGIRKSVDAGYREVVDLSLLVFLASGALLTFERLSSGAATPLYAIVLGIKVLLSVLFYRWAFQLRRGPGWEGREARLLVGLGFLIVLFATVLKTLYEAGLRT